jgi:hypothetical protein
MVKSISRAEQIGCWIATVPTIMAAASVASGAAITSSVEALWLLVGTLPPSVMLVLWGSRLAAAAELVSATHTKFPSPPDCLPDTYGRPRRFA